MNVPGFEIVRQIGSGAMGVVYQAIELDTGTSVAVKTIDDATLVAHLKHEFRIASQLHHDNLVKLRALRQHGEQWFLIMELLDGKDLLAWTGRAARAAHVAPQSDDETLEMEHARAAVDPAIVARLRDALRQLADGLDVLHAAGLVHRDLKPSNVLVDADRLVILDFGLTHDAAHAARAAGTIRYMSPEQSRGEPVTGTADWYAVGVIVYEILTGSSPFAGSVEEILAQKRSWLPVRPSTVAHAVPADLDDLCVALLDPDPRTRATAAAVRRCAGTAPSAPSARVPLLGRDAELAQLAAAATSVGVDRPAVVVIEGESGVGKTALLAESRARLEASGVGVLHGRCIDRELSAYAGVDAVIDELATYLGHLPSEILAFALPRYPALLRLLFPVTATLRPVRDAPAFSVVAETRELRQHAFNAYRDLLCRLTTHRQIAIFVDDAQWLTAEGWAFLEALVVSEEPAPILLVLAQRDTAPRQPAFAGQTRIALGPLDESASIALVKCLAPSRSTGEMRAIVRDAHGHPLFLQELARAGAEGTTLEDVLRARIAALPPPHYSVLSAIAVAVSPVPPAVLSSVVNLDARATTDAIHALQSQRLVAAADGEGSRLVRIYHDRIRAAIQGELAERAPDDAARLSPVATLHRRLAAALETVGADAAILAIEWAAAGDAARAAHHARHAAKQAMTTLAFEHASHMYQLALVGTPPGPERVAMLALLGDALASAGHSAEAADAYMQGARDGSLEAVDDLLHRGAEQLIRSGHVDEGKRVLREVFERLQIPVLESRGSVMRALLARRFRLRLRRIPRARKAAPPASPVTLRRIDACWSLGDMLGLIDPIQAAAEHAAGLLFALDAGEPYRIVRSLAVEAAFLSLGPGGRPRARELLAAAADLARETDRPEIPGWLALGSGISAMLEGSFLTAHAQFERAHEAFDACVGTSWESGTARQMAAWNDAYLGRLRSMRARCAAGIEEATLRANRLTEFNLRCGPSHLASLADDRATELLATVAVLLARWDPDAYPMVHLCALFARTQALLYLDRADEAVALLAGAEPAIRRSRLTRSEFYRVDLLVLRARAMVMNNSSRATAALDALRRENAPWGRALAAALDAVHARDRAALAAAIPALEGAQLHLYAEAARWHVKTASRYFTDEGVVQPERLARMLLPM